MTRLFYFKAKDFKPGEVYEKYRFMWTNFSDADLTEITFKNCCFENTHYNEKTKFNQKYFEEGLLEKTLENVKTDIDNLVLSDYFTTDESKLKLIGKYTFPMKVVEYSQHGQELLPEYDYECTALLLIGVNLFDFIYDYDDIEELKEVILNYNANINYPKYIYKKHCSS